MVDLDLSKFLIESIISACLPDWNNRCTIVHPRPGGTDADERVVDADGTR